MAKENAYKYDYTKYIGAKLEYTLSDEQDKYSIQANDKNLELIKDALDRAGIILNISDEKLSIEVDPKKYVSSSIRNAGPKDKRIRFNSNKYGCKGDIIKYSDMVFLMQTMSDKDIMAELEIPYATYYRHKKVMLASDYYKELDFKEEHEEDYYKSPELMVYDMNF